MLGLMAGWMRGADTLPAKPAHYFNDYARLIPTQQARAFDARLAQFERETSNQLVVAIYPQLPPGAEAFDFTMRAAQIWAVGQKGRNNGAVLFVFVKDRDIQIRTGYGLEGALPDALCHTIVQNELKPRFRVGDYAGGLDAAINALIAATRGEYKGTGRIHGTSQQGVNPVMIGIFIVVIVIMSMLRGARRTMFGQPRRRGPFHSNGWGGWSGGGGGWSGGGGGFSGGGGSFGGGGAGGKW